jgi:ABC-type Zn uptake system ZnuABC Zn-binding protein ZnuA
MGSIETRYQQRARANRPARRSAFWAGVCALLVLVACGGQQGDGTGRLSVVTSLELFADFVRQVGGADVEVTALLPSGADPHTFELAPARVADLAHADLVFMNGLGLEGRLRGVIETNAGGPVVELAAGLPTIDDNPHLWLDPQLAARYVERVRDALIEHDPTHRDTYTANAQAYLDRLAQLDVEFADAIASIPPERRKLVTFHDAFPYLAQRYGLEVVAVVVPSPGQEPSAQQVAALARAIQDEGVPAVYKEPQFNASVLELAARDAGVRVLDLLSDAYIEGVDSYLGLMQFNLRQLQEGLGGA